MPISAIDLFRPPQMDSIAQILGSANNVLTGALNNAIQIGRDSVNLRATQEREYLAERERVEALNQRKTEFAVNKANADRQFAENVFQDRRDFKEKVFTGDRAFEYDADKNAQDTGIRLRELRSLTETRAATTDLATKTFNLRKEEKASGDRYLRQQAYDLLGIPAATPTAAEAPGAGLMRQLFNGTGIPTTPPESGKVSLSSILSSPPATVAPTADYVNPRIGMEQARNAGKIADQLNDPVLKAEANKTLNFHANRWQESKDKAAATPRPRSGKAKLTLEDEKTQLLDSLEAMANVTGIDGRELLNSNRAGLHSIIDNLGRDIPYSARVDMARNVNRLKELMGIQGPGGEPLRPGSPSALEGSVTPGQNAWDKYHIK